MVALGNAIVGSLKVSVKHEPTGKARSGSRIVARIPRPTDQGRSDGRYNRGGD